MERLPAEGPRDDSDAARVRISDADRQRVADLLRDAAGEGRLEIDELEERLEVAWNAKVAGDLVPLLDDLPAGQAPATSPPQRREPRGELARHDHSVAIMGGKDRRGPWEIGATHTAVAMMGGVDLDLREARFASHETEIAAIVVMGGIDVIVGPDVRVVVDGIGIMGAFDEAKPQVPAELSDDSPVVRVRGLAIMGAVEVKRKGPPRRRRRDREPGELDGGPRGELR